MSSTESKYIDAAEALMEAVWIRNFIDGLGGVMPTNKRPIEMLCDNETALAIAGDPRILKGARHFQRKYHYIREVIQEGISESIDDVARLFVNVSMLYDMNETFVLAEMVRNSRLSRLLIIWAHESGAEDEDYYARALLDYDEHKTDEHECGSLICTKPQLGKTKRHQRVVIGQADNKNDTWSSKQTHLLMEFYTKARPKEAQELQRVGIASLAIRVLTFSSKG
ncbi:hypothetical protein Tco_0831354 [Tanacetum coccineum]